jgi:hypothetical protein
MNAAISVFAAHAHDRAGNLDLDRAVATTVQLDEHSCAIRYRRWKSWVGAALPPLDLQSVLYWQEA